MLGFFLGEGEGVFWVFLINLMEFLSVSKLIDRLPLTLDFKISFETVLKASISVRFLDLSVLFHNFTSSVKIIFTKSEITIVLFSDLLSGKPWVRSLIYFNFIC